MTQHSAGEKPQRTAPGGNVSALNTETQIRYPCNQGTFCGDLLLFWKLDRGKQLSQIQTQAQLIAKL